jgi:hypothetical protein
VVPIEHLLDTSSGPARVALRHDIDAELVTGIRCARRLASLGLAGTFFVLHSSHYYARVERDSTGGVKVVRHHGFARLLDELLATGQEVGLHNDALGYAFDHGVEGAALLVADIDWLRERGATVRGTVAHNSAAVYGAECFEIFRGLAAGNRREVIYRERHIPLQVLDPADLSLTYEGNFPKPRARIDPQAMAELQDLSGDPLRRPAWQRLYFGAHPVFERGYEYDLWLIGPDQWLFAGNGEVRFPLNFRAAMQCLETLPEGTRCVVTIHPIYVSAPD